MPSTATCSPCCTPAVPTQVPGIEGAAGLNGTDGINAYTELTAQLTVPAVGANVTANVEESGWVTYGQTLVIGDAATSGGPATFLVVGIPTTTSLTLQFQGYPGDVAATTVLPVGSLVSPAGVWGLPAPLTVYAAGTAYSLTNAAALLDFGTTDPTLVISAPGTYLLLCRITLAAAGATVAAETATLKLRRTNNTAADITNSSTVYDLPAMTTLTHTIAYLTLQPLVYTTANSNDSLSLYGQVSATLGAGTIDATEASIIAIRLY